MELVGATFGDNADYRPGVPTKLRAKVVGDDVELADCVRVGYLIAAIAEAGHVEATIKVIRYLGYKAVRGAVRQDLDLLIAKAVDSLDILYAWHKLEQAVHVPVDER